jgi:hypothetical protein
LKKRELRQLHDKKGNPRPSELGRLKFQAIRGNFLIRSLLHTAVFCRSYKESYLGLCAIVSGFSQLDFAGKFWKLKV